MSRAALVIICTLVNRKCVCIQGKDKLTDHFKILKQVFEALSVFFYFSYQDMQRAVMFMKTGKRIGKLCSNSPWDCWYRLLRPNACGQCRWKMCNFSACYTPSVIPSIVFSLAWEVERNVKSLRNENNFSCLIKSKSKMVFIYFSILILLKKIFIVLLPYLVIGQAEIKFLMKNMNIK